MIPPFAPLSTREPRDDLDRDAETRYRVFFWEDRGPTCVSEDITSVVWSDVRGELSVARFNFAVK